MTLGRVVPLTVILALTSAGVPGSSAVAGPILATWTGWRHLLQVDDVAGVAAGGDLVAAAFGNVWFMSPHGSVTHSLSAVLELSDEFSIAVSPGQRVGAAGCSFGRDEIWSINPIDHSGVTRVNGAGERLRIQVQAVERLSGMVFDTKGHFGHRLLVSGESQGRTVITAIDCLGTATTISDRAPPLEGGLAVAPESFGALGGDLIGADERSGRIIAIAADGSSAVVADSGLPAGADIGVEAAGFVPAGFLARGGYAYVADAVRPGGYGYGPGSGTILRLSSTALDRAGVRDGDLLVAAERGGDTVDVRCDPRCSVRLVAHGPPASHIEGHLLMTIGG